MLAAICSLCAGYNASGSIFVSVHFWCVFDYSGCSSQSAVSVGSVGGRQVSAGKFTMIFLLVWLLPSAWLPVMGFVYEAPYTWVEIDSTTANFRMLSIRSAAFMTVVYFVSSYLRHQRPLSSVLPILVFAFWLILFHSIFVILHSEPVSEWLVILGFCLLQVFLTIEYLRDSNKIFKDSW